MSNNYIVRQNGYKDCGAACLLSIMKYYGYETSLDEISYIVKTTKEGTNAYNIINGSKKYGFDGYGIHYTYEEIVSNKITFPIICHVQKDNMYHFIVVYKSNKNYLQIMDPSSNIKRMNYKDFKNIYLGTSIVIYPVKEFHKIEKPKELLSYILDYITLEKSKFIITSLLAILVIILSLIIEYYSYICLDYILPNYKYKLLINISLIFIMIIITKVFLNYIYDKLKISLEKTISININRDVINKLFNLPYQFFKSKSTGEVMSRIEDIKDFKDISINIISNVLLNTILILFSFILLVLINKQLLMINLISILSYFLIVISFKRKFDEKTEELLNKESEYTKVLQESICGYETEKNINLLQDRIKLLEQNYIVMNNRLISYKTLQNKEEKLKDLLVNITHIITVFISIILLNKNIITIGEFTVFNSIMYYFNEPIKNILDLVPNITYIKHIYNRLNDIIIIQTSKEEINDYKFKGDISIYDLSYSIDGLNNIFDNVNLKIKYGSKFLIYGKSGNGKSTIMKIILKYLNDYKGEIYIGNTNLKDISSYTISNNMTYISQHSYIYNDTLKNNIISGREVRESEYERMLYICNLINFRNKKRERNNFMIEDDGFNISGGERQKIILARSLLKESNYIILDEALSEVGLKEEQEIINKIFDNFKDKTIIYISHKKEIINMFNLKYKLERRKS